MPLRHDIPAIEAALRLLCDDRVTELRAFDERGTTLSGYFDDWSLAARAVAELPRCKAVYFCLNGCDPALLARSANRIRRAGRGETTGDQHVPARHWLLIDVDPTRPAGISATAAEKEHAHQVARRVYAWLRGVLGFPEPIVCDSGNGYHLLFGIAQPGDDGGLVQRCLQALAERFNTTEATVDTSVYNAARICKLPGTVARKGDSTEDRPHRLSRIVTVPDDIVTVPEALLQQLAGMAPVAEAPRQSSNGRHGEPFDVGTWIAAHGIQTEAPRPYSGQSGSGTIWQLPVCPFNSDHANGEARIIQYDGGKIHAGCYHSSCTWRWQDLRERFQPGCYDHARTATGKTSGKPAPEASAVRVTTRHEAAKKYLQALEAGKVDLVETGIPELDYAVGGGLAYGEMVIVAARPSHGKSCLGLQCLDHLAGSGVPCAFISEEMSSLAIGKRSVQFLSDSAEEHWRHQIESLRSEVDQHFAAQAPCFILENCRRAEVAAEHVRRLAATEGVRAVAIDYIQLLAGPDKKRYEGVTEASILLRQVANETGVLLLVMAQLNREVEKRSKFVPQMSDLKESGQLEQDSDVVLFLVWPHRINPSNKPDEFQIWIGKNRDRATNQRMVECRFAPSRQRIHEAPAYTATDWEAGRARESQQRYDFGEHGANYAD